MRFKLRAFTAWRSIEPGHTIIVADFDRACACETAAKFWNCLQRDIQVSIRSATQKDIRNMKSPGVAWVVDLVPVRPPRKTFSGGMYRSIESWSNQEFLLKPSSYRAHLEAAIMKKLDSDKAAILNVSYEPATVINKKLR